MSKFSTIKGTHDLLPNERFIWQQVENSVHSIMQQNGYGEIRTPAFENTDLFVRGIGKTLIFCVSQKHASKVTQILNVLADKLFPNQYLSDFAALGIYTNNYQ